MEKFPWCKSAGEWRCQVSGWQRDEDGWWSFLSDKRKIFQIKFTKEGEEKIVHDESTLQTDRQLLDLLQHAKLVYPDYHIDLMTAIDSHIGGTFGTADGPAPSLESLRIHCTAKGGGVTSSILEAIITKELITKRQLVNLLQHATHLRSKDNNDVWVLEVLEVLKTTDNPAPSLESLEMTQIQKGDDVMTESVLEAMKTKKLTRLKFFSLNQVGLSVKNLEILAGAISSDCLPCLRHLHLKKCNFGPGHPVLARAMESDQMPPLQTFFLFDSGLDDVGCEAYASSLCSGRLRSLTGLIFEGNKIGRRGAEALGHAIESGNLTNLARFELVRDPIGSTGHIVIARAMESGKMLALTRLNLSKTRMGDIGCDAYATSLSSWKLPSLVHVNFGSNEIGSKGAEALGLAIQSGCLNNLVELNLVGNTIPRFGRSALAKAVKSSKILSQKRLKLDPIPSFNHFAFREIVDSSPVLSQERLRLDPIPGFDHFAFTETLESSELLALERLRLGKIEVTACEVHANASSSTSLPLLKSLAVGNEIREALRHWSLQLLLFRETYLKLQSGMGSSQPPSKSYCERWHDCISGCFSGGHRGLTKF